jgi:hypothetical protein
VAATDSKAIGQLYALPLEEFVARRDELARSLRGEGERELAEQVKALRKPSVAAWVVNQLARQDRTRVGAMLEAGARLRAVHGKLLQGGPVDAVQRATAAEREAVANLVSAAERLLADAGRGASPATLERVGETLHAAAVDEDVAQLVREGRLVEEQQATGFGAVEGMARPGTRAPKQAAQSQARTSARRRAAEEKRRAAEQRLRDAKEALAEAEQTLKEHERSLQAAERELSSRRSDVERAEREAERARAAERNG